MKSNTPPKLKPGDEVRIVAPSSSLKVVSPPNIKAATERLHGLGLNVTFGRHVNEKNEFGSSRVSSRISDIHQAFRDNKVKMVLCVIGGYNANQLLDYLDFDLIRKNPKIFCGYSDITVLNNTIYAKTGLVTYSGPSFSSFAMLKGFDYSLEYFTKCLFSNAPFTIQPRRHWSDDKWYMNQNRRKFNKNSGLVAIQSGKATGRLLGGNLCTLNLLQGTRYMPNMKDSILFLEDDDLITGPSFAKEFDRNFQSLIQQPGFSGVRGIVFGKFQSKAEMAISKLKKIIGTKKKLRSMPILADFDFGHTTPQTTLPIGGKVKLMVSTSGSSVEILRH